MSNGAHWPLYIGGRRYLLMAWVEKGHDGVHRLTVSSEGKMHAHRLEIATSGLVFPVEIAGISLNIVVGPAAAHLLSLMVA